LAVRERQLEFFVGLLVERFSHPVKRLNDVEQVEQSPRSALPETTRE
jgi:hypothetical protein